jgi:hypothetical protein
MKILICFFASFVLALICVRCDKDCANTHFFDLPLKVYGISDTVSIGDTITIKINIPDKLREQETDTQYEFIDYDFKLVTYPVRLDSLPLSTATANSFNWFTITGESLYANDEYLISPTLINHEYIYEAKIVPKKKGLFLFSIFSFSNNRIPLSKPNGPCKKGVFHVAMKFQNNVDANFHFLQESLEPAYQKTTRKVFDENAGFCFYVR